MSHVSTLFTSLIAEAIGLSSDAFSKFFDPDQQHKLKIVKYPEVDVPDLHAEASEMDRKKWEIKRQGVGYSISLQRTQSDVLTFFLKNEKSFLGWSRVSAQYFTQSFFS